MLTQVYCRDATAIWPLLALRMRRLHSSDRIYDVLLGLVQLAVPMTEWMTDTLVYLDCARSPCIVQLLVVCNALITEHINLSTMDGGRR